MTEVSARRRPRNLSPFCADGEEGGGRFAEATDEISSGVERRGAEEESRADSVLVSSSKVERRRKTGQAGQIGQKEGERREREGGPLSLHHPSP